jgi:GTPase KRas protein
MYMKRGQGFLLVYSITSKGSFNELAERREQILHVKGVTDGCNVPIVLVGNKTDIDYEREITKEDGQRLANDWQCPFLETSAKIACNVDEAFYALVREVRRVTNASGSGGYSSGHGKSRRKKCVIL